MNDFVNSVTGVDKLQQQLDQQQVITWIALAIAVISLVLHALKDKK